MSLLSDLFGKKDSQKIQSSVENLTENVSSLASQVNPLDIAPKEKTRLADQINQVGHYLALGIFLLIPLTFMPLLADIFEFPKQSLLLVLSLLGMALIGIKSIVSKKLTMTWSPLHLPALLLLIITLVSAFLSDNRYTALSLETVLIAGLVILFLFLSSLIDKESFIDKAIFTLLSAGAILSVLTLIQIGYQLLAAQFSLNINHQILFLGFSPTGSSLSQLIFLISIIPLAFGLFQKSKEKNFLPLVLLTINVLGSLLTAYLLYQNPPILLDFNSGWKIAANTLGNTPSVVNAFFGIGPSHFVDAFTATKPLAFNSSPWWNLRFPTSSNYILYLLTTLGIAGLASFIFLLFRLFHIAKGRLQTENLAPLEKALIISLGLLAASFIILPAPIISLFLFFSLLGLLIAQYKIRSLSLFAKDWHLSQTHYRFGLTIAVLGVLIFCTFSLGQFALADYHFGQSLQAVAGNDGQKTYQSQIQALTLNPWSSTYRVAYSQTNLALANSLAGQPNLTDEQKQTVVQLVQQSLREGRIAVTLQPRRSGNWENLSVIYRNLINFAQGADQWAIVTQNQAISLDPNNPRLRLDMGGIIFATRDFQNAALVFSQAVNLKPDFANAHYNLAQALKQLKINDKAKEQLQLTATLICTSSAGASQGNRNSECQKVNDEISRIDKEISQQQINQAGSETQSATPAGQSVKPTVNQPPLATPGANTKNTNLPKARTQPPAQISSPSGQIER